MEPSRELRNCRLSLSGLSVGDAFGETFFGSRDAVETRIAKRVLASPPWRWTDDTAMAISIVETLEAKGHIDQDDLGGRFAKRYMADPRRGYGGGAHGLLAAMAAGTDWRRASRSMFGGLGSWGNGAAMRASPLGAYFAGDPERAAREAALSAEITHSHPEGIAGAVAVAVAASFVAGLRAVPAADVEAAPFERAGFFSVILDLVAEGRTKDGIETARYLAEAEPSEAAKALGTGTEVSAMDTVPFCLWAAARWHDDFEEALWATVAGLGDRDTTCAIVGGIVALSAARGIPRAWIEATEEVR